MKRKSVLSLYMSKRRRKRRRKEGEGRYVGRPRILSNPLPNKDLDSTVPFIDDFSTEECETDIGEFSFNFNVKGSKQKENMAGTGGVPRHRHPPPLHHHPLQTSHHHPQCLIQNLMVTTFGTDPTCITVMLKSGTSN